MGNSEVKILTANQLYPYISHVVNKYKHKIPKDDLKRFAKDIAKKLVNSDYKAGKVSDPTKIDDKKQKKIKAYCTEFFERAAKKHQKMEDERAARKVNKADVSQDSTPTKELAPTKDEPMSDGEDVKMSHEEQDHLLSPSEISNSLKRKRSTEIDTPVKEEQDHFTMSPLKRPNSDTPTTLPVPPPPPPPPAPSAAESPETLQHEFEVAADVQTDLHADTNFKKQSMADVLAQAQQENGEDEADYEMEDEMLDGGLQLENPLVNGQDLVERGGMTL